MNFFAQYGKDKLLNDVIFKNRTNGVFIDIGANDGITINSTYFFEKYLNWSGVCVEPLKRRFNELVINRPNSVCLNCAIWEQDGEVEFSDIEGYPEMLSGITECYNEQHEGRIRRELNGDISKCNQIKVPCISFSTLLSNIPTRNIDYLKIDTEGAELRILRSIDFNQVNIEVIDVENNYGEDYSTFLKSKGYYLDFKHHIDEIYRKS